MSIAEQLRAAFIAGAEYGRRFDALTQSEIVAKAALQYPKRPSENCYAYRFAAARGLEYRLAGGITWYAVSPVQLSAMTANELRAVADAMGVGAAP